MFKTPFLILFLSGISLFGFAQVDSIVDVTASMSKGTQSGISLTVPFMAKEDVVKSWIKSVKAQSQYTIKTQQSGEELQIFNTELKGVTERVTIYTLAYDQGKKVELVSFFELPDGFVSPQTQQGTYLTIKNFVAEFAASVYKEALAQEQKEEEKILKDLQKDAKKLNRKKERIIRKLNKEQQKVKEIKEDDLVQITANQEQKKQQIKDRLEQARALEHKDMIAQAEKIADGQKKELKKLEKKEEKLRDNVLDCQEEIREYERELESYNADIETQQNRIASREARIQEIKRQLD